jgi:hypothetical protein
MGRQVMRRDLWIVRVPMEMMGQAKDVGLRRKAGKVCIDWY